jgi:hypothetical protein
MSSAQGRCGSGEVADDGAVRQVVVVQIQETAVASGVRVHNGYRTAPNYP